MTAVLALTACPKDDETETTETPPVATNTAATPAETATATPTTTLAPEAPGAEGVEAKAKAELDGKTPDAGFTGTTLAVAGTKVSFTVPTGWKATKSGDFTIAPSADEKARFGAGGYKDGDDSAAKLTALATAMSLTDCQWSTPESISMGKDKLPATVSDGVCKRGGASVKAIASTMAGKDMNVVSMGAWDEGGDSTAVFNTFRSAKKAGGGGDPTGIAACCSALRGNAASAPLNVKGNYLAAAAACDAVRNNPQGRAALAGVRSMLAGANIPAACR